MLVKSSAGDVNSGVTLPVLPFKSSIIQMKDLLDELMLLISRILIYFSYELLSLISNQMHTPGLVVFCLICGFLFCFHEVSQEWPSGNLYPVFEPAVGIYCISYVAYVSVP